MNLYRIPLDRIQQGAFGPIATGLPSGTRYCIPSERGDLFDGCGIIATESELVDLEPQENAYPANGHPIVPCSAEWQEA